MTTQNSIITLFYALDQEMLDVSKYPEAKLYPSAVGTLAREHSTHAVRHSAGAARYPAPAGAIVWMTIWHNDLSMLASTCVAYTV
jgi:hypothetical protein